MSVTLSPPVRIFAFAGGAVAVGLALFFFLVGRTAGETASNEPLVTREATTTPVTPRTPAATPARTPRATQLPPSGFPLPVHRALRRNRVVVVVVYMPGASVDAVVRARGKSGGAVGRSRARPAERAQRAAHAAARREDGRAPESRGRHREAPGRRRRDAERHRPRRPSLRRSSKLAGDRARLPGGTPRPRAVRASRAPRRQVGGRAARDRPRGLVRRRGGGLAEGLVLDRRGPAGPYSFKSPVEATRFVTHAVEALIALGCEVHAS